MESSLEDAIKIDHFMDTQTKLLKLTGLWPLDFVSVLPRRWSVLSRGLSALHAVVALLLPFHLAVFHLKSCIDAWGGNVDDLADVVVNTIIYSFIFLTTLYFLACHHQMKELVEYCDANFKKRSSIGLTFVTASPSHSRARTITFLCLLVCECGTLLWAIYPLLVGKRILPLNCWYPFDNKQPYVYELVYLIQFLGQVHVGLILANGNAVFVSAVIQICGQYDILFCSFKNMYHTAKMLHGWDIDTIRRTKNTINLARQERDQYLYGVEELEDLDVIRNEIKKESEHFQGENFRFCLMAAMRRCVEHHRTILKACKMVEKFFSWYCFVKSFQISYQMCFLTFVIVNTNGPFLRTVNLFQYLVLTVVELVFFTYYGELLARQSQRVGEALLRAPWGHFNLILRKEILIILSNSVMPFRLTGKFFIVNTRKIRSVITAALSYFTLLQSINIKKQLTS